MSWSDLMGDIANKGTLIEETTGQLQAPKAIVLRTP